MEFLNTGEKTKVRVVEKLNGDRPTSNTEYRWLTVDAGAVVDLPEKTGLAAGFEPNNGETPAADDDKEPAAEPGAPEEGAVEDYLALLRTIRGVGKKTAEDIAAIYPSEDALRRAVEQEDELPLRDDIAEAVEALFR